MHFPRKFKKPSRNQYISLIQSIFSGTGKEYNDMRTYTPGDSPRTINRKQSTKHNTLFTNLFIEEKTKDIIIYLDINYNRNEFSKQPQRQLFFQECETFAKRNHLHIQYKNGTSKQNHTQWQSIINHKTLPKTPKHTSHLPEIISEITNTHKPQSIFICSDFLDIPNNFLSSLKQRQKKHDIFLIKGTINNYEGQNYTFNELLPQSPQINFYNI